MKSNQKAQKPLTRKDARERFEWIKTAIGKGKLNTATLVGLVAEVAAFRSLGYITEPEAAPYLRQ